ncbi:MAG: caspase family protein, partial [Methyloligellaceae bacterium]
MRRPLTQLILTLAFTIAGFSYALAEKRVALVIGNAAYEHTPVLKNPLNDARRIAQALKSLDFEVIEGSDQNIDQMRDTIKAFRSALEGADVALLYFAGHGIQVAGKNYLMPVSAKLEDELDLRFGTISLDH